MLNHRTVAFDFQATYYTLGDTRKQHLWFVFHGYGQLARYFIRKFDFLQEQALVVAPEGLSSFYLEGTEGRVGASWMTREQRLLAIQNNLCYLDTVYQQINTLHKPVYTTVLGFSQGVATLVRWLISSKISFNRLIMCAGSFPEEITKEDAIKVIGGKPCYYLYGDKDPYMKNGNFEKLQITLSAYGLQPDYIEFAGGHTVSIPDIQKIMKKPLE